MKFCACQDFARVLQQLATFNFPLAMLCFLHSEFLEDRPPCVIDIAVDANATIGALRREVYDAFKMAFERARISLKELSLYPLVSYIVVPFIHLPHAVSAVRPAYTALSVGDASATCEGVSAYSSPNCSSCRRTLVGLHSRRGTPAARAFRSSCRRRSAFPRRLPRTALIYLLQSPCSLSTRLSRVILPRLSIRCSLS